MFTKNIIFAFRNLRRDKFYTLLNGFGLTLGMMVALLIFMWASDEISYDNYHKNNGQIYRVLSNMSFGGDRFVGASTPAPLAQATRENIPEVQQYAIAWKMWNPVLKSGDFLLDIENGYFADPSLLEMLDFDFIQGDPKTALNTPNSIILTEATAYKIFGQQDPMGKTISVRDEIDVHVTAIIKNTPTNTHLQVDCLVPFEVNSKKFMGPGGFSWGSNNFNAYVMLRPGTDAEETAKKMTNLIPLEEDEPFEDRTLLSLQPVRDVYLESGMIEYSPVPQGNWTYIKLLSFIGLLILLIASINYVNLTTARSAHRAKATGIRKVIGASKKQLVILHLLEAFCLVSFCALGALFLAYGCLPIFEELSGKSFPNNVLFSAKTILLLAGIAFTTILLSGIQPAFQLAAFRPAEVLKGSQFNGGAGKGILRKVLVVAQFVSSAALVICTLFMLRQLNFVQATNLGYEKEQVFMFQHRHENPELVTNALSGQAGILEVSKSDQPIVDITSQLGDFDWEGRGSKKYLSMYQINVDHPFQSFFDLEITEGRWFHPGSQNTTTFVINEAAVKTLQMENPVGKWIDLWGERGTIVGILKDFHFKSFHHKIEPLIIRRNPEYMRRTYVKTTGAQAAQAIASAEKVFKSLQPNEVFKYEFLDEQYNQLYKTETRIGKLFLLFAIIAIFISCLGIFGLATYTAERRFKEIGIRKVLGASVFNIVQLLSKDFLLLVVFSLFIAIPIAWYFMRSWLENFAYHIQLDWWVFALAAVLAIGIAFITVSLQSLRAAVSNPVDSIKTE